MQREGKCIIPEQAAPILSVEFSSVIEELAPDSADGWDDEESKVGMRCSGLLMAVCAQVNL
jgi:hypothetical protein